VPLPAESDAAPGPYGGPGGPVGGPPYPGYGPGPIAGQSPASPLRAVPQGSVGRPTPTKKSRRALLIVAIALVVIVGGVIGYTVISEAMRSNSYDNAISLMEEGDYQGAYDAFRDLGTYRDSWEKAALCDQYLDYEAAQALMDAEEFEAAKEQFEALGEFEDAPYKAVECGHYIDFVAGQAAYAAEDYESAVRLFAPLKTMGFEDAAEWYNKSVYGWAGVKCASGDPYGGYKDFNTLGDFADAAARALGCTTPYPGTGELFHDDAYRSNSVDIIFDGSNLTEPYYIKVYSGGTLVSTLFINVPDTVTINVPAGDYTFKAAHGAPWFGDQIMFGDDGSYYVMVFDDGGEVTHIDDYVALTLTLNVSGDGNIGAESVDPDTDF
jgi:hypothetical protein